MNNNYLSANMSMSLPVSASPPTKAGVRQALDGLHEVVEKLGNELVSLQSRTASFRIPLKSSGETAKDTPVPTMSDTEAYILKLTTELTNTYNAMCQTTDSVRD